MVREPDSTGLSSAPEALESAGGTGWGVGGSVNVMTSSSTFVTAITTRHRQVQYLMLPSGLMLNPRGGSAWIVGRQASGRDAG